jgi:hypothetical protein
MSIGWSNVGTACAETNALANAALVDIDRSSEGFCRGAGASSSAIAGLALWLR